MKKCCLIFFLLYSGNVYNQSPGNVAGYSAWLKGDFKKSYSWTGDTVTLSAPAKTYPVIGQLNYNDALQFEGQTEQVFIPLSRNKSSQATVFVVYQAAVPAIDQSVWKLTDVSGTIQLSTRRVRDHRIRSLPFKIENAGTAVINTYIKQWKSKKDFDGG